MFITWNTIIFNILACLLTGSSFTKGTGTPEDCRQRFLGRPIVVSVAPFGRPHWTTH